MRLFQRQITSPRFDTLLLALVGWSLIDVAAVALIVHPLLGTAHLVAGLACFVAAVWSWQRRGAHVNPTPQRIDSTPTINSFNAHRPD